MPKTAHRLPPTSRRAIPVTRVLRRPIRSVGARGEMDRDIELVGPWETRSRAGLGGKHGCFVLVARCMGCTFARPFFAASSVPWRCSRWSRHPPSRRRRPPGRSPSSAARDADRLPRRLRELHLRRQQPGQLGPDRRDAHRRQVLGDLRARTRARRSTPTTTATTCCETGETWRYTCTVKAADLFKTDGGPVTNTATATARIRPAAR